MVDSRLRVDPPSLFHCFIDILSPTSKNALQVTSIFPEEFDEKDQILKQIPGFCYPCSIDYNGVQYSTFVLTDLNGIFRFGFCRYPAHATHCLCILSYLPWFETFYAILDHIARFESENDNVVVGFLGALNSQLVPEPGAKLSFRISAAKEENIYKFDIPDTTKLPSIPDNRNLTEYFAKVTPENMVYLFISMLFERRIIVTSERLSVLTAVVHGSVSLLYPMQWQHIYVPILPPHLIDYCCAPMPFLLGIHSSMMEKVEQMPMNEVVIFNADSNEIYMLEDDLKDFPSKIFSRMKKKLQRIDKALADYVSSQFLNALADMIGGYKEALKFTETEKGGKIVFDDDAFLNTRTGSMKDFLVHILNQQSFRQFIAGRLEMLNDGVEFLDIFDQAVLTRNIDMKKDQDKYKAWKVKMKKGGGAFKKTVEGKYLHLRGVAGEIEVKELKNKLKNKVKDKVKDVKVAMKHKEPTPTEIEVIHEANVKRNNSMPLTQKNRVNIKSTRHSMYSSLPRRNVPNPGRTPPPRPPRPDLGERESKETNSAELPRKQYLDASTYSESKSAPNIVDLIDMSSPSTPDESSASSSFGHGLDSAGMATSDSDSSIEHINSYSNPAFLDLQRKNSMCQEETVLEHSPLPHKKVDSPHQSVEQQESTQGPSKPLKRSVPVTSHRFAKAPPRPAMLPIKTQPPLSDGKTPPTRPPPPSTTPQKSHDCNMFFQDKAEIDDLYVVIDANSDSIGNEKTLLPSSPFYTPSSDLLDLDQSLFQETMQSVSEDTRMMMSNDRSTTKKSSGEVDMSHSPTINMNIAFLGESEKQFYRSRVLTQNPSIEPGMPGTEPEKTLQNDPFASILEDVKKDMKINNTSEATNHILSTSVQPRTLFTSSLRRSLHRIRKKDRKKDARFYQEV